MSVSRRAVAVTVALVSVALLATLASRVERAHASNQMFTNDTGEPAGYFLLVVTTYAVPATVISQPAACGTPQELHGLEYVELIWPTACIGPGESITLDTLDPNGGYIGYSPAFYPAPLTMTAVSWRGDASNELTISATTKDFSGAVVTQNAPGCPDPAVQVTPDEVHVTWSSACVDHGEQVVVHVAGGNFGGYALLNFSGPLPYWFSGPTVLGGLANYPEVSSGTTARRLAGALAGALAMLLAGGAFAWRRSAVDG